MNMRGSQATHGKPRMFNRPRDVEEVTHSQHAGGAVAVPSGRTRNLLLTRCCHALRFLGGRPLGTGARG
jgi:hypothetical protein